MVEPRLDPLLQTLDNVELGGQPDDDDRSRSGLRHIEQVVEQRLEVEREELNARFV